MSEKRGEVIVPAGRRYQQKQHELLPAAKGLKSKTTPTWFLTVANYALQYLLSLYISSNLPRVVSDEELFIRGG